MTTRLRLTRNQLAVIAHGDAESIRQLELLVSTVNQLATDDTIALSTSVPLEDGSASLQLQLPVGRYLVRALVLASGSASMHLDGTATRAASTLATSVGVAGASPVVDKVTPNATIYSASDDIVVAVDGAVEVTATGSYGVVVTGTGTVQVGSYFSARRIG